MSSACRQAQPHQRRGEEERREGKETSTKHAFEEEIQLTQDLCLTVSKNAHPAKCLGTNHEHKRKKLSNEKGGDAANTYQSEMTRSFMNNSVSLHKWVSTWGL